MTHIYLRLGPAPAALQNRLFSHAREEFSRRDLAVIVYVYRRHRQLNLVAPLKPQPGLLESGLYGCVYN